MHGITYQVVLDSLEEEREKLVRFLRKQGFDDAEIRSGLPSVERAYEDVKNDQGEIIERRPNGYDGSLSVTVNTKKLDKIQTAEQAIRNLRAKNDATLVYEHINPIHARHLGVAFLAAGALAGVIGSVPL